MFNTLFESYLNDLKTNNQNSNIYKYYLEMSKDYQKSTTKERVVIDYIAGMTDDYFITEYNTITK